MVPTSGWKNGSLGRVENIVPPADGILDLDFYADAPEGIVLQVISKIEGGIFMANAGSKDFWGENKPLKGFRIHAKDNKLEVKLPDGGQAAPIIDLH